MYESTEDRELGEIFMTLIDVEEGHKRLLVELLDKMESSGRDSEATEEGGSGSQVLEGGYDVEEFTRHNASMLKTAQEVIMLAMMLETQSLDLYLRFVDRMTDETTRDVLFKIADQEKAHLAALGNLLEQKKIT
jgi:rubrerythrin